MSIKKTFGTIVEIEDLSKTSKEIKINLDEQIDFIAGQFVNLFLEKDGEKIRRAYSISSSDQIQNTISLSIRLSPQGKLTPLFWNTDLTGKKVELMGPLGLNSADKMNKSTIYLFGFGIGAGVAKSLVDHFEHKASVTHIVLMTGSRTEDEIIYKNYFDTLAKNSNKLHLTYVISQPSENSMFKKGYIQDHIEGLDFNNSDVYVCGQEIACTTLTEKIKSLNPNMCDFFVEAFH